MPSPDVAMSMRRAIACALGWTDLTPAEGEALSLIGVPPGCAHYAPVPDWANDLDAASSLPVRDGDVMGVAMRATAINVTFHPDTLRGYCDVYSSVSVSLAEPNAEARARSRSWLDYWERIESEHA